MSQNCALGPKIVEQTHGLLTHQQTNYSQRQQQSVISVDVLYTSSILTKTQNIYLFGLIKIKTR